MKKYSSITRVNYRRTSPKRWRIGGVVLLVVVVLGWLFPRLLSGITFVLLYPVHTVSQWYDTSQSSLPQYLRARESLIKELEVLRRELDTESGTELTVKRLQVENEALRAATLLGTSTTRVVARVLAPQNRILYDLLQIDQGTNAGLTIGAPVFVGMDSVVGTIVHTTPTYSFVELFTSPGFSATAFVIGPNIFAPLEGMGGGVARVKVPQGVVLTIGDLVLLPSVESGVYGEIVSIENLPTQPEQYGYVTPAVPLRSMSYVSALPGEPVIQTTEEITEELRTVLRNFYVLDTSLFPSDLATSTGSTTASTSEDAVEEPAAVNEPQ